MNYYYQYALEKKSQINTDSFFFHFCKNTPYTSLRTRHNRLNAYLFQKLVMMGKYGNVKGVTFQLLQSLTSQYFFENYYFDNELAEEIIYYNILFQPNVKLLDLFHNPKTPHKQKFRIWLKKLTLMNEEEIKQNIENKKFDSEYLNTPQYQILLSICNKQSGDLSTISNGIVLLSCIEQQDIFTQYQSLKEYKDGYLDFSYVLKKQYLILTLELMNPIEINELNRLAKIDQIDTQYQTKVISTYINTGHLDQAINQLIEHLLNSQDISSDIWKQMLFLLEKNRKIEQKQLNFIKAIHFGNEFILQLMNSVDERDIEDKCNVLEFIDIDLYQFYTDLF